MVVELEPYPRPGSNGEDFAELSRLVRDSGLLAPRRAYYGIKISLTIAALSTLIAIAVVVGDTWWNLVVAVGLAFVLTQLGFIGHDAGHRQISSRRRGNDVLGLLHANMFAGFSFGWWLSKHNRHHAHTNRQDEDPDMAPGAIAYIPGHVEGRGPFGRSLARVQALTLLPLMCLEALNMHVASAVALARRRDRGALVEGGLLLIHAGLFFVAPFLILSPLRAVAFITVTQLLFGFYLGASFVTNHVGMPTLVGKDDLGFLRRQLLTSRNLCGSAFSGFIFGGLDTQIEHHLFPNMPRANLRRASRLVRPYCAERRIDYVEQRPLSAYLDILRYLRRIGRTSVAAS